MEDGAAHIVEENYGEKRLLSRYKHVQFISANEYSSGFAENFILLNFIWN
jgi:hypothetical protein